MYDDVNRPETYQQTLPTHGLKRKHRSIVSFSFSFACLCLPTEAHRQARPSPLSSSRFLSHLKRVFTTSTAASVAWWRNTHPSSSQNTNVTARHSSNLPEDSVESRPRAPPPPPPPFPTTPTSAPSLRYPIAGGQSRLLVGPRRRLRGFKPWQLTWRAAHVRSRNSWIVLAVAPVFRSSRLSVKPAWVRTCLLLLTMKASLDVWIWRRRSTGLGVLLSRAGVDVDVAVLAQGLFATAPSTASAGDRCRCWRCCSMSAMESAMSWRAKVASGCWCRCRCCWVRGTMVIGKSRLLTCTATIVRYDRRDSRTQHYLKVSAFRLHSGD